MPRFKVSFWLDISKENECELLETVQELKRLRTFSRTIRDGIRLINDLSQGKTDVLSQLFPNILENYLKANTPQIQLMSGVGMGANVPPTVTTFTRKESPKPDQTELSFTVTQATLNEHQNPTYNLMLSMAKLHDSLADLPTEILEYGIKNKKIPESAQKIIDQRSPKKLAATIFEQSSSNLEQKSSGGPKLMAGAALQLPPPEDIELDFGL